MTQLAPSEAEEEFRVQSMLATLNECFIFSMSALFISFLVNTGHGAFVDVVRKRYPSVIAVTA